MPHARWRQSVRFPGLAAILLAAGLFLPACGEASKGTTDRVDVVERGGVPDWPAVTAEQKDRMFEHVTSTNQATTEFRRTVLENAAGLSENFPGEAGSRVYGLTAEDWQARYQAAIDRVKAIERPDAPTYRDRIRNSADLVNALEAFGEWSTKLQLYIRAIHEAGSPLAPTIPAGISGQLRDALWSDYQARRRVFAAATSAVVAGE